MEKVTLTLKEQKRLKVLNEVEAGRMTMGEAAELLGVSERQVYRLKKAYREKEAAGLAHGNRGKPSPRARTCIARLAGRKSDRALETASGVENRRVYPS
jgi:transposase